ncbi:cytochrome P450 [Streptomyces sp. LBUM 1484]|nr:cytochrome P450 [Streptomyces sp. LBUM 1484]MBP5928907.1 cytochrome P450 [Streptomyces sp. LBUM 1479]
MTTTAPLYLPHAYRLYEPGFAQDPHAYYTHMRAHFGDVAPIEISPGVFGHLVIGYRLALQLLRDTQTWSKDPTVWVSHLPKDSPVLGMLGPRPNPLFADGERHARYRRVITDSFGRIQPHHLRDLVREIAALLIGRFAGAGIADLIAQYARPIPSYVMNRLFGQPDHAAPRLVTALAGLIEGGENAAAANAEFEAYMRRLLALKTGERGHDLTSWIMDHSAGLSPEEVLHHVVLTVGAGQEPTTNLIANALAIMLSDDRYYAGVTNGALAPIHAVHRVLRDEPPMANYAAHYPRHNVRINNLSIPAHSLVMVSFAAANADPQGPGAPLSGEGSHLAWSAGPHACPVKDPAILIAVTAIEEITSRLPDLELDGRREDLQRRIGPFHTAYRHIPATFTP